MNKEMQKRKKIQVIQAAPLNRFDSESLLPGFQPKPFVTKIQASEEQRGDTITLPEREIKEQAWYESV